MTERTFKQFFVTDVYDKPDLVLFGFVTLIVVYVSYRLIKNLLS